MEEFSCLRFGYFFKLSNNDFDGQLQEALGADCVMESIALTVRSMSDMAIFRQLIASVSHAELRIITGEMKV